ncbi:MAG: GNAT family N-acetyltransferase [Candidatus Hodarchaeales archaeon]
MKVSKDVNSIINKDSSVTTRIYSMFDDKEENVRYFINKSAIIVHSWSLGIYTKELDHLSSLLSKVPKINNIFLNGIPTRLLPLLEESFYKIIVSDSCHIWTLQDSIDQQSYLENLSTLDSPFIYKNWSYHNDDSLWYIKHCIDNYPSSVIRDEKEKPARWAFSYSESPYHVNMGGLLVLPAFRGRRYGRKITIDLSSKIFQSGRKLLVHVHISNQASQNLLKNLGFVEGEEVFFGRIQFEELS